MVILHKMDSNIVEHLPIEIVNTLDMYFDEGKYVNDFRITGNSKGFSITLHFCNPAVGDLETWSPGLKHKSPSARQHDHNRRLKWEESILKTPTTCDTSVGTNPQPASADKGIECDLSIESDEVTDVNIEVDNGYHDNHGELSQEITNGKQDSSRSDDGNSEGEDSPMPETVDESEMNYRQNILKQNRNKSFSKVVHDTRNGHSKVIGISDDIIITVDEIDMRYNTYAIHDRNCDEECGELYYLVHKWPRANPKKCRYGVDTLDIMLPDIVAQLRKEYMGEDEET